MSLKSVCFASDYCQLMQSGSEVVSERAFVEEQVDPCHLFELLGQILSKSQMEEGAAWAASGGRV